MKYCRYCGSQIDDDSVYCPSCGKKVENVEPEQQFLEVQQTYQSPNNEYKLNTNSAKKESTLKLVAFILALLTCIGAGILIIPLIWMIPMTITIYKAYKGEKTLSTGFKVCTLIFLNTISGILLLCDND